MLRRLKSITRVCVLMVVFAFTVMPAAGQADTPYIAWSPDGRMLAVGHGEMVQIIDASNGQVLNTFDGLGRLFGEAAWSPDGNRLAIANFTDVEVWEQPWNATAANLQITYQYYLNTTGFHPPASLNAWNPNGSLISTGRGEVTDIWNVNTGQRIQRLQHPGLINAIAWNPDGQIASAGSEEVTIWDIATGERIKNFLNTITHVEISEAFPIVFAISWNPDGTRIALGGADGRVRIWDTTTSEFWTESTQDDLGVYEVHSELVRSVDWSPTGQYIASGSQDHTISIIDAQTGQQVQVIQVAPNEFVNSVAWSPDGSKLAYGNPDGSVTLFDATQLPGYVPMATAEASSND